MKSPLIVDIETVGTAAGGGRVVTVAWMTLGEGHAHVEAVGHLTRSEPWPADLLEMMADPDRPFVSFTKYDARFMRLAHGIVVEGPQYDVQTQCWTDNENQSLSLEKTALRYSSIEMDKRIKKRSGQVMFECDNGQLVPLDEAPLDQLYKYNVEDTETEAVVFEDMWLRLDMGGWLDYWLSEEVPFTRVLVDMECRGMPIDLERTEVFAAELEERHAKMAAELYFDGGLPASFNINSGDHIRAYLFSKEFRHEDRLDWDPDMVACLKSCYSGEHEDCWFGRDGAPSIDQAWDEQHIKDLVPQGFTVTSVGNTKVHGNWLLEGRGLRPGRERTETGLIPVSRPVLKTNLSTASDPWVQQLLEYRSVDKLLTTYLRKFPQIAVVAGSTQAQDSGLVPPATARIYGRFNQTGTKTGRLSSSEPNMQNIPSHGDLGPRTRDLFRAPAGRALVVADASQLEPRIMAHYSQDPRMMAVYRDGGSGDIYADMALGVFGEFTPERRNICKTLVLAMGYGAGDKKVGAILTVNGYPTDVATGAAYVEELRQTYPRFFAWRDEVIAKVHREGHVVTIGGRHRRLKAQFIDRRNWKNVGYGERQAVNAIIQGTAADIMRRCMVRQSAVWKELDLLAQVHDELVNEAPDTFRATAEYGQWLEGCHGYELSVPLLFEPHIGESWHEAKEGAPLELPDDMELDDIALDFEEE